MDITDAILTIIIFLIFAAIYSFNIYYTGKSHIQENWENYKCNPLVIPFTKFIWEDYDGHLSVPEHTESNKAGFDNCVGGITKGHTETLLKPIKDSLGGLTNIAGELLTSLKDVFSFLDNFRNFTSGLTIEFNGTFDNILGDFNVSLGEVGRLGEYMVSLMHIVIYIMQTTVMLGQSIFAGPLGAITGA